MRGSECRHGHFRLPQERWCGSQAVMTQRLTSADLQAAYGGANTLLSFDWASNPFAPFNRTQFCTRRSVSFSFVPFLSHNSMRTSALPGTILVPKAIPFGN